MCAERRFLNLLRHKAFIAGVSPSRFPHWLHKKIGNLIVIREKFDGELGTSIPCILCRKILERGHIQWSAHIADVWYKSVDEKVPLSKFTHKQMKAFRGN